MNKTYLPFEEVYRKLKPTLRKIDEERRIWRLQEIAFIVMTIVGFVMTYIGLFHPVEDGENRPFWQAVVLIGGIFMILFGLVGRSSRFVEYREIYNQKLAGALVKAMDPSVISKPNSFIEKRAMLRTNLELVGTGDSYTGKNLVMGKRGDTHFRFSEIQIGRHDARKIFASFKGLFFEADFHKHFHAKTIIKPRDKRSLNLGYNNPLYTNNGERVHFEDVEFEKNFDVYSTDPVEARYIISTRMMSDLNDLQKRFTCKIYASFFGDNMYLAIDWKRDIFNRFFSRPATSKEQINEYYNELILCFNLVDALNLNTRIWSKRPL